MAEGACLCGEVRVTTPAEPLRVGLCHCLDCRKHGGAPFAAAVIFAEGDVTISGETRRFRDRYFCPTCGSTTHSTSPGEVEIALGLFPPDSFRPSYELWTCRREGWLPEIPGLARHPRNR